MKLGEKLLIGLKIGEKMHEIQKLGQKMSHSKSMHPNVQYNIEETEKKYISPLEKKYI